MILPVMPALAMFSIPVTAQDVVTGEDANRDPVRTVEPERTIYGSFQPVGEKQLKMLPEGFMSEGAMILKVKSSVPVSFSDLSETAGVTLRQTYINHAGERWRVHSRAHWANYGGFQGYLCEKYYDNAG